MLRNARLEQGSTADGACTFDDRKPARDESASALTWLDEFRRKHGRAPRILHIGNIANNAYNNAKILNQAGFDCDVLCHDYYHIMGCPEWEDADFLGDVRNHFRPDWYRLNLQGFRRPRWFAQGPLDLCVQYLIARRAGRKLEARHLWHRLARLSGTARPRYVLGVAIPIERLLYGARRVFHKLGDVEAVERRVDRAVYWLGRVLGKLDDVEALERGVDRAVYWLGRVLVRLGFVRLMPVARADVLNGLAKSAKRAISFTWRCWWIFRVPLRFVSRRMGRGPERVEEHLCTLFHTAFPDRPDQLSRADVVYFSSRIATWRQLFGHYDVIQAYSTHVIYPMLAGTPYIAFEHGTLRDIPFQDSATGRLTALAYHRAHAILVTNYDCVDNAHALGTGPVRFISHPYDEDHGLNVHGAGSLRQALCRELEADFLIFFPTRQDWVLGRGYADKANDVFLRAFARLRKSGLAVGMICCEWGHNVDQSKALLRTLCVERYVCWKQPMGIVRFERYVLASDLVADQFKLGAFGGVLFKAMAVGVPVCTYLDKAAVAGRFPEVPPVINCRTEEEVVVKIEELIRCRTILAEYCSRGRAWIKAYHSGAQVVATQAELYHSLCDVVTT